jgi:hypothetical protein
MIEFHFNGQPVSRHRTKEAAFLRADKYVKTNRLTTISLCEFRDSKSKSEKYDFEIWWKFRNWFYAPMVFFEREALFLDGHSESLFEYNDL